jgi:hypothetical protein
MKRKKAPIPRSNATNAYDLLSDVAKVMLAEPKRVNMARWIERVTPSRAAREGEEWEKDIIPSGAPDCGTVGCIAGWILLLLKRVEPGISIAYQATDLLGGTYATQLCHPPPTPTSNDPEHLPYTRHLFLGSVSGRPGTRAYARRVVKRIHTFQQIHKVALKAKRLKK